MRHIVFLIAVRLHWLLVAGGRPAAVHRAECCAVATRLVDGDTVYAAAAPAKHATLSACMSI